MLVALALLAGCGEGPQGHSVEILEVDHPDGGTVDCALTSGGGVDCAWDR